MISRFLMIWMVFAFLPVASASERGGSGSEVVDPYQTAFQQAEMAHWYESPVWLKLLHLTGPYQPNMPSEMLGQGFYLSGADTLSPRDELMSSIGAFFEPIDGNADEHFRCQFPARALWIKTRLDSVGVSVADLVCPSFSQWAKLDTLDSIGVVLASGYLGNPASAFGHVLIKANNSAIAGAGELLERSINFGALIPPQEPGLIYVLKGLFGGYVSGFSDQKFYLQDLIYTRTEFRDLWEYHLNLNDDQQALLMGHLWELNGEKFRYYFLKQNCAWRVAELIELVTDTQLRGLKQVYLPRDLFFELSQKKGADGQSIVSQIQTYPSAQRQLFARFEALSAENRTVLNDLLSSPSPDFAALESLSDDEKINLLDVGLLYFEYKLGGLKGDTDASALVSSYETGKHHWLMARLSLPPRKKKALASHVSDLAPPTSGNDSRLLKVGVTDVEGSQLMTLGASAAYADVLGGYAGGLEQMALKVLDVQWVVDRQGQVHWDYFTLVEVEDLNPMSSSLIGEHAKAWRLSLGSKRVEDDCLGCQSAYFGGGLGQSFSFTRDAYFYALAEGEYQHRSDVFDVGFAAGLVLGAKGKNALLVELRGVKDLHDGEVTRQQKAEWSLNIKRNHELRASIRHRDLTTAGLAYHYAW